jgi:nucleotide-binding universal stress UspA family protein
MVIEGWIHNISDLFHKKYISMKKILLPTDFSANAREAIDYAVTLFEKEVSTFYILNAYYTAPPAPGNKFDAENNLKQLVEELEDLSKNLHHSFKGIVEMETPLGAINITAINHGIDLIIMGTKGASGLRSVFLGSNTAYVIKYIENFPILAVPESYEYDLPKKIVFANDFKKEVLDREVNPLIEIAKLWDSELVVVHIEAENKLSKEQKVNKSLLHDSFKSIKYRFDEENNYSSVSATIRHIEKEQKSIGMVAMLKNKHGFVEQLLRESVIRNVAFTTKVPFLVLPTFN